MNHARMKLKGIATLLVDNDHNATALMQQMLRGMGLDTLTVVDTAAEARGLLRNKAFDLCIIEAQLPDGNAAAIIREVRQMAPPMRFIPIIVVTAYSHLRNVLQARDAGASSVIRKPISPQVLFDHIGWSASSNRAFIESEAYTGPDRRFKFTGPPGGVGRRTDDLKGEIGEASEPNMSQDEIDAMIKPTKVLAL